MVRVTSIRFLVFVLLLATGHATEVIRDYVSTIDVMPDATLRVRETIVIRAEGNQVRHGIYRDFPTLYRSQYGLRTATTFEVLHVRRDGQSEPWHTEARANGIRLYVGDASRIVAVGEHAYELEYRTSQQLGFYADHDELFWNVTGNGWVFPIEHASARLRLPTGAQIGKTDAFTGSMGSQAHHATATPAGANEIELATNQRLGPAEGLTVLVTWQKGIVADEQEQRMTSLLLSNAGTFIGVAATVLAAFYLAGTWLVLGRKSSGALLPRKEPPASLSPAAARFLYLRRYDRRCMAAAILSLAQKGALTIVESARTYTIRRAAAPVGLTGDEAAFYERLFAGGEELAFTAENAHRIAPANETLKVKLAEMLEPTLLVRQWGKWWLAILLSAIAVAAALFDAAPRAPAVFLLGMTLFATLTASTIGRSMRGSIAAGAVGRAVFEGLAVTSMLALITFIFVLGDRTISPWTAGVLVANVGLIVASLPLLRMPTAQGWRVLDELNGFRRFLAGAETSSGVGQAGSAAKDFARFLPFAVALDIERKWGRQFSAMDGKADAAATFDAFDGSTHIGSSDGLAIALGAALTSAIASSSTPPGSDGGGGGGGDSGGAGGGGGGGGGGGW